MANDSLVDDLVGDAPAPAPEPDVYFAGRPGGRPPHFATPEALAAKINEYFASLLPKPAVNEWGEPLFVWVPVVDDATGEPVLRKDVDKDNKEIWVQERVKKQRMSPPGIPTVAGLALFLGFGNYRTIYKYEQKSDEFGYTVKRAVAAIAEFAQNQLINGNTTGAIFWLKNHGWADKVQTELYGKDGGAIETKDVTDKDRGILKHFVKNYGDRA